MPGFIDIPDKSILRRHLAFDIGELSSESSGFLSTSIKQDLLTGVTENHHIRVSEDITLIDSRILEPGTNGMVEIPSDAADNQSTLFVESITDQNAVTINGSGTTSGGMHIEASYTALRAKSIKKWSLYVDRNSNTADEPVSLFINQHASDTENLIEINNGSSGRSIYAYRNVAGVSVPVVEIAQQNTSSVQNTLKVTSVGASTGIAATIYGTGTSGIGIHGYSTSNYGVYGQSGSTYGVYALSDTGSAIRGEITNAANNSDAALFTTSGSGNALRVVGKTYTTSLKIGDTSTTGYVWTATDANGNGSWQSLPASGVTGSGTANKIAMFTSGTAIGNSRITYNDTNGMVEIPWVSGDAKVTTFIGSASTSNNRIAIRAQSCTNAAIEATSGNSGSGTGTIATIYSVANWTGAALLGISTLGRGLDLSTSSGSNTATICYVANIGTGKTAEFITSNSSNNTAVVLASTTGTGRVIDVVNTNSSNNSDIIRATSNGTSSTLYCASTGSGRAAYFQVTGAGNNVLRCESASSTLNTYIYTNAAAGIALQVEISHASGTQNCTILKSNTSGNVLYIDYNGGGTSTTTTRNLVVGLSGGVRQWRIDNLGKGFFNGGTQTGGADCAWLMSFHGSIEDYEPGDVLVISTSADRRVRKTTTLNDPLIIGVVPTKPGISFVDPDLGVVDDEWLLENTIPVAFMGIVPVKVVDTGGAISRGDYLVASATSGHAQKLVMGVGTGLGDYAGVVIGRALSEFDASTSTGTVLVRVNVS